MDNEPMTSPVPLPTITQSSGFTYTQVKRTAKAAIYRQSGASGDATAYEVIVIRTRPAMEIHGRNYPYRETYPSMGEWGTYGWTYTGPDGLALAEKKMEELG